MSTNLEESVVLITSSNPKYQDNLGTGFVIYREAETTYLLTCAHVVKAVGGKDNVLIYGQPATVIASSDVNDFDLAVIQVKHEKLINRPVLKLQNYSQGGTSVKAAGYYLYSEEKKRSLSTIEGVLGKQKYREDQDTGERAIVWEVNINNEGQLQKGYSGSPVVEQDSGLVIGVVTNMGTGGQIGEIISIEALEIICPWLIEKINQPKKDEVELKSEKGVDYTKLEQLLAEGKWKEADQETGEVMCQAAGSRITQVSDIDNFPCEDLRIIDQLWLHYSNGKFGFSVQKEIYDSLIRENHNDRDIMKEFDFCVGWRERWYGSGKYKGMYESRANVNLSYNLDAPRGCLPHSVASSFPSHLVQRLATCSSKIELKSVKGIDYTKLLNFLAAGKWKEADQETAKVMCQAAGRKSEGWLRKEDIDNFSCEDLGTINQLWLHYSQGKFGFSVQKEIYQSLKQTKYLWENFGDRVGWRKDGKWLGYFDLNFDLNTPDGHLPVGSCCGFSAMRGAYPVGVNYGGWIYKGTITPQPPMGGVPPDSSSSSLTASVDVIGCFCALFSRKDL